MLMTSNTMAGNAVLSVAQLNKKQYQLALMDGQQLELAVVDMFNVHVRQAGRSLACATFQPLSSLNNLEMQPVYRMVSFQAMADSRLDRCQHLLESVFAVYAYYTNGSIRPWRHRLK
jgi:hypothetical protein